MLLLINLFTAIIKLYNCFSVWHDFVNNSLSTWVHFHNYWITDFKGPVLIIHYSKLKTDLKHQLQRITDFLGITVSKSTLKCAIHNKVGNHQRSKLRHKLTVNPYTSSMRKTMKTTMNSIMKLLSADENNSVSFAQ